MFEKSGQIGDRRVRAAAARPLAKTARQPDGQLAQGRFVVHAFLFQHRDHLADVRRIGLSIDVILIKNVVQSCGEDETAVLCQPLTEAPRHRRALRPGDVGKDRMREDHILKLRRRELVEVGAHRVECPAQSPTVFATQGQRRFAPVDQSEPGLRDDRPDRRADRRDEAAVGHPGYQPAAARRIARQPSE
ncbi:MAG: hypothetical protein WD036_11990 [Bauldia sp.]